MKNPEVASKVVFVSKLSFIKNAATAVFYPVSLAVGTLFLCFFPVMITRNKLLQVFAFRIVQCLRSPFWVVLLACF